MFGTLVYNEIIILPFLGFDKNTKVAIAKRMLDEEGMSAGTAKASMAQKKKVDTEFVPLSPGAGYDATRNKRALNNKMEEQLIEEEENDIIAR